ncbi:MAG: tRNA pseudouridine(55) synthase TruB [Acidobacteriota bacterium]
MNGILVIDKPQGPTSHDVVARARRALSTKRVGHTGTLDPFATGVMILLVGKATRLAQFLDKDQKEYEAVIRFGSETDTGDKTGTPRPTSADGRGPLTEAAIKDALDRFRGEIEQIPPMYSAKKIDGQKLYTLARQGRTIERPPAKVTIFEIELIKTDGLNGDDPTAATRVVSSAGTYIRTLAEDIGRALGTGAHLAELRRTRAGRFDLLQSITLDQIEAADDPARLLTPMSEAVAHLPQFLLDADRIEKTRNGLSSRYTAGEFAEGQAVRMIDEAGDLIAIGRFSFNEGSVQPIAVLM